MKSRGIIYIATGRKYVDEALSSARSVKAHMPDIQVSLFSDLDTDEMDTAGIVDSVFEIAAVDHSCRDKIRPLLTTPFDKTLFLDTDTFVCEPVYDVFDLLDRFDIALAQAPDRYQYHLPHLPDCFTEFNSGVIAFRKNRRTIDLLASWEETFFRMLDVDEGSYRDQHSLRDAIYRSDARLFVLPPEYNFRTICPNYAGKNCQVKIIHGRHADFHKVSTRLNRSNDARVFLTTPFRFFSRDLSSYESFLKATMNACYESLPTGVQEWLTRFKTKVSS
jgi:hypothetical protein